MTNEPVVYVGDAGSHAKGNFHWVSSLSPEVSSMDPGALAQAIASDIHEGRRVALGWEAPLFVPLDACPTKLGQARPGECQPETGPRAFTAAAGASALVTGLQSLAWVLREIQRHCGEAKTTTRWADFQSGDCQLFIWEAFVSGSEKAYPPSHAGDAALAIQAFK